ncbi:hypothetical protein QE368_000070 [Asaia bogorensis NBRC 16594]|nr:hypothetical protein [Asaia bogorensis NBRC 16594]
MYYQIKNSRHPCRREGNFNHPMTSLIGSRAAISMSFTGEIEKIRTERVCALLLPLHPVAKARWAVGGAYPITEGSYHRGGMKRPDTKREATRPGRPRCVPDVARQIAAELSSCSVTVLKDRGDLIMASVMAMTLWPSVCANVGPPMRRADCGIMATEPMTRFVPDGCGPAGPRR